MKKITRRFLYIGLLINVWVLNAQDFEHIVTRSFDFGEVKNGLNSSQVGKTATIIGDVNADGFDDWAVALNVAAEYATGDVLGRVNIYLGSAEMSDDAEPDIVIWGQEEYALFGNAVAGAGDVNNDGYDDIIVDSFIFLGGQNMDTEWDLILHEEGENYHFATVLASAGDVNGDGFEDVLIGAPAVYGDTLIRGKAFLYLGGDPMDGVSDVIFEGAIDTTYGARGFALSIAGDGDFNNDGYDDIIIGGQSKGAATGAVYIYKGGVFVDNEPDYLIEDMIGAGSGTTVSYAGDVNGDGCDDFIAGLPLAYTVHVYYGGDVPNLVPDVTMMDYAGTFFGTGVAGGSDINNDGYDDVLVSSFRSGLNRPGYIMVYLGGAEMDPDLDKIFVTPVAGDSFGYRLDSGGDLNGDGYGDFICGTVGNLSTFYRSDDGGNIYLFLGNEIIPDLPDITYSGPVVNASFGVSVDSPGDLNADGFADFVVGASEVVIDSKVVGLVFLYYGGSEPDNIPDKIFRSEFPASDIFFGYRVINAGDLNGDGINDMAVSETSAVRIFYGGADMDTITDVNIDLGYYFTRSLKPVGDVNDDGYDDILVGADYAYTTKPNSVWLYLGGPEMDDQPDMEWTGTVNRDTYGHYTSGIGDINMDGYDDFIVSVRGTVTIFLGGPDIMNLQKLDIINTQGYFGFGIAGGQDLNADGYPDFAIGMKDIEKVRYTPLDKVYIYFGSENPDTNEDLIFSVDSDYGLSNTPLHMTPDINDDGFPDLMITTINRNGILVLNGGPEMDEFPDDTIQGFYDELSYFYDEQTDDPGIIAGLSTDNSAGYHNGRVNLLRYLEVIEVIDTTIIDTTIIDTTEVGTSIRNNITPDDLLSQNMPNPFSDKTFIRVNLPEPGFLRLELFDIYGKNVSVIAEGTYLSGENVFEFDGSNLKNGIYVYRLNFGRNIVTRKMVVGK